jgi:hypothetical protein
MASLLHPDFTRISTYLRIHTHELIYPPTATRNESNDHQLIYITTLRIIEFSIANPFGFKAEGTPTENVNRLALMRWIVSSLPLVILSPSLVFEEHTCK